MLNDSGEPLDNGAREQPRLVLMVGEKIDNVHTIIDADHPQLTPPEPAPHEGGPAKPLGSGGSGTVYLASYRGMQYRAIKFLTLNYLSGVTGRRNSDFQSTFSRERIFLSTLSHGNVARLYDFGEYTDRNGVDWQYIVTDYVAGRELIPALEASTTDADSVYKVVCQVLRAVEYMHLRRVLHADIKSENIRCRESPGSLEAILLDLGTAHYVPHDEEEAGQGILPLANAARVRFITTDRILHPRFREYSDRVVNKNVVQELFPQHDLYSIGVLFEEIVQRPAIEAKLRLTIGDEGLAAFASMIASIKESPVSRRYRSVHQIHEDWHKLRRTYLAPVGVPELSLAAEFKYSIQTAAGRGVITPRLAPLVNHKLFQRLRRVPQLEMTLLKFPGATHTRFSHSMTVLRNTRYYLAHLLNDTQFRLLAEKSDLEAAIILAMLHDVGHYQLSHMFEDYSSDQRGDKTIGPWASVPFDIPSDDDLFWCVVDPDTGAPWLRGDYGKRIGDAWRRSERELGLEPSPSIADTIREQYGEATYDAMVRIHHGIYRPGTYTDITPAQYVIGAVLSSDIDADKISYLTEDADRSGVNYGAGVDFDGLLGALRMPALDDIGDWPTLGITRKGVAAAQSMAISRNLMVGQVYWHHSNRAATAMVKYAVARLLRSGSFSMPAFIEQTFFAEYDAALRFLFDQFNAIRGTDEVNPIANLLEGERRLYKTAFSTDRLRPEVADAIGERLTRMRFDNVIQLEEELCAEVRKITGMKDILNGEVLVDVPLKERERPSGERGGRVFVYTDRLSRGPGIELREYGPFLKQIKDQHARENRICRVFVSERVASSERADRVAARISEIMRDRWVF